MFGKNPRDEGKVKRGLVLLCVTTTAKELGEKFLLNKRELDFGTDPTGESGVEGLDVPWMNFLLLEERPPCQGMEGTDVTSGSCPMLLLRARTGGIGKKPIKN